jgi:hypothetical protein
MEFFVGSLSYEVTASDLAAFVATVVEPSAATVWLDRDTGRSRGFGGIDVPDRALLDLQHHGEDDGGEESRNGADVLLKRLNGALLLERRMTVSPMREPSFLSAFDGALNDDAAHVVPDEEQLRDGLLASQKGTVTEEALTPTGAERVQAAVGSITFIDNRILDYLADHRAELHELLNPRQFEELCYELLRRTGFYDLELTRQSRDGGVDIRATRRDRGRRNLYIVECKHWDPLHRVGGPVVQQTFGVMGLTQADKAMVVTSSYFTAPAIGWQAASRGRLILRNRDVVGAWIRGARVDSAECMLWLAGDP